jgi:hypothetical protein
MSEFPEEHGPESNEDAEALELRAFQDEIADIQEREMRGELGTVYFKPVTAVNQEGIEERVLLDSRLLGKEEMLLHKKIKAGTLRFPDVAKYDTFIREARQRNEPIDPRRAIFRHYIGSAGQMIYNELFKAGRKAEWFDETPNP